MNRQRLVLVAGAALALAITWAPLSRANAAPQFRQSSFGEMRWRLIGPFRGGRTVALAGVPTQPNVFYIGVNDGGVWKTTDYGQTWNPIFDDQPTGSIGALAIAPSNPDIVYVGSGEGLRRPDLSTGDGIYKSVDAGRSWVHLGLRDGQQLGSLIVDPSNPDRVFAAVLGHPYGPNAERGVFRTLDGGQTWQKVLYKDENVGAIDLAFAPGNANKIYADMWSSRQAPWENGGGDGPGSGLYESSDGGDTWRQLTQGLPTWEQGLGRIGFTVAPSDPNRMYALVDAKSATGVYRSDDAGESWRRVNSEDRVVSRGSDFAWVRVAPDDEDRIYVSDTSTYRSDDGGRTFTAIKGAPGGDDYHSTWINPLNSQIIALSSDQGATISVNGGATWSSWYNQPTAQMYHVSTDNRFPYWVYGGQQESGSAGVASRGNDGEITAREWHPVGAEEYGFVAPDPLNPNIVYGGKLSRFDWRTGQVQDVSPVVLRGGAYRMLRTEPVMFSPTDPHTLFFAANVLFKTRDGGHSWTIISPDLSRPKPEKPAVVGPFSPAPLARRGVIYALAPSPLHDGLIWAGTDDGLIWRTADGGKHWSDVTPPELTSWSKVAQLDASHFDPSTVYAAINRFRLDDLRPYIYRTHDGGKSWTLITNGLPDNAAVNVVREDPLRPGLLYAGSERAVYVSFDDGDRWQPLQLNLPPTSMRDLTVHGDDLVVATHGRSFWILDDVTPLRQLTAAVEASQAYLFAPEVAFRVQRNQNTDTPLPPEVPHGQNPPDGAIIDYYLGGASHSSVTLAVYDAFGALVRRYSSAETPVAPTDNLPVPTYWVRQPQALSSDPGMHRFVWDLHYPTPPAAAFDYPISAVYRDTPPEPQGPLALPGRYTVRLTVDGKVYTRPLVVKMDPRVTSTNEDLVAQSDLAHAIAAAIDDEAAARERLAARPTSHSAQLADTLGALDGELAALLEAVDAADRQPTVQQRAAFEDLRRQLHDAIVSGARAP